jgi:hypothetical protein
LGDINATFETMGRIGFQQIMRHPPLIHAELWLLVSLFHYVDLDGYG